MTIRKYPKKIVGTKHSRRAATAMEYAIILGLLLIAAVAVLAILEHKISQMTKPVEDSANAHCAIVHQLT